MLEVLEFKPDASHMQAQVVIGDSDVGTNATLAHDLFRRMETRNLALKTASMNGLSDPGVTSGVHVYPVDAAGNPIVDPRTQKIASFRASLTVSRRMV